MVAVITPAVDMTLVNRLTNDTTRIVEVFTIPEFAAALIIAKFLETPGDSVDVQMPQTKISDARRIDEFAATGKVIQTGYCGGMLTQAAVL